MTCEVTGSESLSPKAREAVPEIVAWLERVAPTLRYKAGREGVFVATSLLEKAIGVDRFALAEEDEAVTADDGLCGSCLDGRCHWGGEKSRLAAEAAEEGREYIDPATGPCGCDRHEASVQARG